MAWRPAGRRLRAARVRASAIRSGIPPCRLSRAWRAALLQLSVPVITAFAAVAPSGGGHFQPAARRDRAGIRRGRCSPCRRAAPVYGSSIAAIFILLPCQNGPPSPGQARTSCFRCSRPARRRPYRRTDRNGRSPPARRRRVSHGSDPLPDVYGRSAAEDDAAMPAALRHSTKCGTNSKPRASTRGRTPRQAHRP